MPHGADTLAEIVTLVQAILPRLRLADLHDATGRSWGAHGRRPVSGWSSCTPASGCC